MRRIPSHHAFTNAVAVAVAVAGLGPNGLDPCIPRRKEGGIGTPIRYGAGVRALDAVRRNSTQCAIRGEKKKGEGKKEKREEQRSSRKEGILHTDVPEMLIEQWGEYRTCTSIHHTQPLTPVPNICV